MGVLAGSIGFEPITVLETTVGSLLVISQFSCSWDWVVEHVFLFCKGLFVGLGCGCFLCRGFCLPVCLSIFFGKSILVISILLDAARFA